MAKNAARYPPQQQNGSVSRRLPTALRASAELTKMMFVGEIPMAPSGSPIRITASDQLIEGFQDPSRKLALVRSIG